MPTFGDRLKHAWNAFTSRDPTDQWRNDIGTGSYYRPDRVRFTRGSERTIVASIYNQIANDASMVKISHVRVDENERYIEEANSGLNNVLHLDANIDQTGKDFIRDLVISMFEEGCVAAVPIDTSLNPLDTSSYDILTMRTGKITEWHPRHVRISLYNDRTGRKEDITMPKDTVAIIENPFYSVMNEPNSILQRLIRKINLLDQIDNQVSSGKLDLIIQLPYVIKTEARRQQAETRRKDIEMQLAGSKYGIAYTDGTEKITQLNRAVENNVWPQVQDLTSKLYNQLGLTETIFNGTADEQTMINYYNRTINVILSAIADEFERTFITKTARTQGQRIVYFREPFKLVPVEQLAEISDKFTRNEIMTSNEIRQVIGMKPSDDPKADELRNSNLNHPDEKEEVIGGNQNE